MSAAAGIGTSWTGSRGFRWLLGFLAARMALLVLPLRHPEGGVLVDSGGYLTLARQLISAGNYLHAFGQDTIWPPGYPVLIALTGLWRSPSPVAVAAGQLLLTAVACVAMVWIGARLGQRTAGLAAGWLYAASPNAAMWAMTVMSETGFAVALVLCLAVFVGWQDSRRGILALAIGLGLGLGCLIRPAGTLLLIVWAAAVFVLERRRASWRGAARQAALVVAGGLLLMVPWMARNRIVHGEWLFSSVASKTFYGFNVASVLAEARGIPRDQAVLEIGAGGDEWGDSLRVISAYPGLFVRQQIEGGIRTAIGVESGVWARQLGLGHEYQGSFGVLSALRAGRPEEALSQLRRQLATPATAQHALLFVVGVIYTAGLYGGILAAVLRSGRWSPAVKAVAILALVTAGAIILSPGAAGQARFRVSAEPLLALLAGLAWIPAAAARRPGMTPAPGTDG